VLCSEVCFCLWQRKGSLFRRHSTQTLQLSQPCLKHALHWQLALAPPPRPLPHPRRASVNPSQPFPGFKRVKNATKPRSICPIAYPPPLLRVLCVFCSLQVVSYLVPRGLSLGCSGADDRLGNRAFGSQMQERKPPGCPPLYMRRRCTALGQ